MTTINALCPHCERAGAYPKCSSSRFKSSWVKLFYNIVICVCTEHLQRAVRRLSEAAALFYDSSLHVDISECVDSVIILTLSTVDCTVTETPRWFLGLVGSVDAHTQHANVISSWMWHIDIRTLQRHVVRVSACQLSPPSSSLLSSSSSSSSFIYFIYLFIHETNSFIKQFTQWI